MARAALRTRKREPKTTSACVRNDGRDDVGNLGRIVLEIGILYDHNIAPGEAEAGFECRGLAAIFGMPCGNDDVGVPESEVVQNLGGPIL